MSNFNITDKSALILEGGGLRGVFTCGVLDSFMDRGVEFPFVVGVSAGACNGLSYISHQRGRAKYSNIDLLDKYNYIGWKYLFTQGNIMDFDLLFNKFPQEIIPYNYPAYFANPAKMVMVTTNCITGEANYLEEYSSSERIMKIVTASSSMPFVSKIVNVDGIPMLDGGITDSIPIKFAESKGYNNNIVVLTRNKGYRKTQSKTSLLSKLFYPKYPNLQKSIQRRNIIYNSTLDYIERMEERGDLRVIRPQKTLQVDRIERDTTKLTALYDEGYQLASDILFK